METRKAHHFSLRNVFRFIAGWRLVGNQESAEIRPMGLLELVQSGYCGPFIVSRGRRLTDSKLSRLQAFLYGSSGQATPSAVTSRGRRRGQSECTEQ